MSFEFDPDALRRIRTERGVSQRRLGRLIGRSATNMCSYEQGRIAPSLASLAAIARALNVHMDDFMKATADREEAVA
ncbi:helix-turn-helix domain-containing protein [Streptomyces kroppenstedtii]|uniref:helix-turn-helix domain-containing protein n=1 Tax=Streptomyces kroppenstedtii TaxID=3051181 RepID=UPI0028D35544|nr:helix-turn-helix transcriptional regulator [Streptomyces sp. DSM 40484]